jgi:flagellar biosynthesis protein FlhF
MKIKHYRAPDMRQALRQVRDAQGPDAVILSSRRITGGVEVVAAVDYDTGDQALQGPGAQGSYPANAARDGTRYKDVADQHEHTAQYGQSSRPFSAAPEEAAASVRSHRPLSFTTDRFDEADSLLNRARQPELQAPSSMSEELRTLRQMLETQMATLAWNDLSRRAPLQTEVLKQLTELGLAADLAGELVAQLPSKLELAEAQRLALAQLSRRIAVSEERWLDRGGIVAMVGPTGVGKTTLIAKLAARWVMRHGPRSLALVSADSVRIGAQEQTHTLGRLLGVPAYGIEGVQELPAMLDHLADRRLVLIDTAGFSQRDARLTNELPSLAAAHDKLEVCLVLSAAAQAGAIEESVQRFAPAQPTTCVLSKLDEATSLGGAISMLIRSRLPLAYVSDGQRIPEDLLAARAHQLIARAAQLSRRAGASADEDLLQRRFGTVAHALA